MEKRILVTGGAGFVGSHLCDSLMAQGHRVVCLDNFFTGSRGNVEHLLCNPRFELLFGDVMDPRVLEVDEVYHLACPASPVHYSRNPSRTVLICVLGTQRMLELCREVGARLLIASTSEVYGDPAEHPQTESYWGNVNPIGPRSCYDEGKRCAEALSTSHARQFGVELRIARIFNTYGPRMHLEDGRVVSNFVVQALRGNGLTVYGDGSQTRSFCYVSDLVDAFQRLMASDLQATPVNLGNPAEFTVMELARKVLGLTGSAAPIEQRPLPQDDPVRRRPDITRAREKLGWEPRVPLEDGLRRTIEHFRGVLSLEP